MSKLKDETVYCEYDHDLNHKFMACDKCQHNMKIEEMKSAKPNTESDKSIDELFAPLIDSPSLTLTTTYWNEAKSELYSLLMDVIGTDEDETNTKDGITNVRVFSENRNQLRAEQRTKLTELFNVKEK